MMARSFGLVFEKVGADGMSIGSLGIAAEIAVCTSVAAESRLFSSANSSVRLVLPCVLFDVTSLSPLICMNCRSSGVATLAAIVSGLAPGYEAVTWITG